MTLTHESITAKIQTLTDEQQQVLRDGEKQLSDLQRQINQLQNQFGQLQFAVQKRFDEVGGKIQLCEEMLAELETEPPAPPADSFVVGFNPLTGEAQLQAIDGE